MIDNPEEATAASHLVHAPQNSDGIQDALAILHDLFQRSRYDGRALLYVSVNLGTKVLGFSKSGGVARPVGS